MLRKKSLPSYHHASSKSNISASVSQPGDPGRWSLPDDPTGMLGLANLHDKLTGMATTRLTYELLQSAVFIILIVHIIGLATFQPRMAIIPVGTVRVVVADPLAL